ncbi:hypothetical protein OA88_22100 [Flavobacterium sp. JRM]|nr:hypothetical protein OA88_22100 [Flavobacterium sp. JRM]
MHGIFVGPFVKSYATINVVNLNKQKKLQGNLKLFVLVAGSIQISNQIIIILLNVHHKFNF